MMGFLQIRFPMMGFFQIRFPKIWFPQIGFPKIAFLRSYFLNRVSLDQVFYDGWMDGRK
jgi:hypothetical protein